MVDWNEPRIADTVETMSGGDNDDATAHTGGEDTNLQELEEPEALDCVDEEKRKQWRPRLLVAGSALVLVFTALGVSLWLTTNKNPPAPSPSVKEFMKGLPAYSLEPAFNNTSSPQAKALAWLQDDPQYNEYELHRLYQRYALAVLYYSANGTYWYWNRGWLLDDNECSWHQDDGEGPPDDNAEDNNYCVEASRLSVLSIPRGPLDGSIPTELELLTDLEHMSLYDSYGSMWGKKLTGKIHSEL
jgi:hypothetical protein